MDKQNVAYRYSGILFSLKKEENAIMCYNMDEPGGFTQILCDTTFMRYLA